MEKLHQWCRGTIDDPEQLRGTCLWMDDYCFDHHLMHIEHLECVQYVCVVKIQDGDYWGKGS